MTNHYDLVIVGAGSGGLGAAISACRQGVKVLLIERNKILGGTATHSGVNTWEMGVGGTGIPFEIYQRMRQVERAVGIYSLGRFYDFQKGKRWPDDMSQANYPGREHVLDDRLTYTDTLRRFPGPDHEKDDDFIRKTWHGVPFEPRIYEQVVSDMLEETGNCDIVRGMPFIEIECENKQRMLAIQLENGTIYTADYWIDATDGRLCAANECRYMRGPEPSSRFDEPSAPESVPEHAPAVNSVTLIFRISPRERSQVDPLPDDIRADCWWAKEFPPMTSVEYPNGDRNCNMLPTMEGSQYVRMAPALAYTECHRRVKSYWHFLQENFEEFRKYSISWYASTLGVRETQRIVTEKVLTENDILAGLSKQTDPDIITIVDHGFDHGLDEACAELEEPYGVPYRCMIPLGFRNMLIASRAAGFSAVAASSCRLSRTMMQLGQAAGTAVAIAKDKGIDLPDVPADELRKALLAQHVQLSWPTDPKLLEYLSEG